MNQPDHTNEQNGLVGDLYSVSFTHTYNVNSFMNPSKHRHACLMQGYWCPKNALRHPQDIIKYLKYIRNKYRELR